MMNLTPAQAPPDGQPIGMQSQMETDFVFICGLR